MNVHKYESGGLDQLATCVVSCPRCEFANREFLSLRKIHKMIQEEIVCGICGGTLSVKDVK